MISNQGIGPLCSVKASKSPQAPAHTRLYLDWQRERQSVILNGACGIRCDISVKHSARTCPAVFVQMKHAEWLLVCVTARRPGSCFLKQCALRRFSEQLVDRIHPVRSQCNVMDVRAAWEGILMWSSVKSRAEPRASGAGLLFTVHHLGTFSKAAWSQPGVWKWNCPFILGLFTAASSCGTPVFLNYTQQKCKCTTKNL